ncbi:uncharacterized protein LOC130989990 [Salvia miltiorrhiza]|uniref:uncharacterized protein LOC130989990 n=1 Tax=Salvia miltiorrhiza TaxID=226208 RepID=UPI0025ABE164|nr:uncharacterized protein LOC130989990 [Salvia miltiorrhiza]
MDSTSEIGALIIEAGASGDLKKLKEMRRKVGDDTELRRICDVYTDFSTGRCVLHHAAEIGHFQICKFLIHNLKVHIDARTFTRDTPLIAAAKGEHVKIVEYLINQGASVSSANSKGSTALHYAVLKDNRELMELLVTKGALLEVDSMDGTPLQIALSRVNVETVKFLLSHGAKPNICSLVLESPLVLAIKAHSFECFDLLLKARADPNMYIVGFSPLSYAAKVGDTKFLKSLLDAGADPNSSLIGHVKIIEDAALVRDREGVEILFPLTRPMKHYPEWTVDGIMDYCRSERAKTERDEYKRLCLDALDKAGHAAMDLKQYRRAIVYFLTAQKFDLSNPKWASKRSLCHAHGNKRVLALYSAEECIRIEPRFPYPHPGGDGAAAAEILKRFFLESLSFTLEPHNQKINDAFRVALFDYFALLYLMSSPEEILSFTQMS